jgi:hypothetical protein
METGSVVVTRARPPEARRTGGIRRTRDDVMDDWTPPRCAHGYIILGCPHDDCVAQSDYLDEIDRALADWYRRQQDEARRLVRGLLGLEVDR